MFNKNTINFDENESVVLMKNLLQSYINVIKDFAYDYTPKIILSLYFSELVCDLENHMAVQLNSTENSIVFNQVDLVKIEEAQNAEQEVEKIQTALSLLENI